MYIFIIDPHNITAMTSKKSNDTVRNSILTKEMLTEVITTFNMLADNEKLMLYSKLPLALKALGMTLEDADKNDQVGTINETLNLDKFITIVISCMQKPNYAVNEMNESFLLFDRDNNGIHTY